MEDTEGGTSYFMEVFDQIRSISLVLRGSDNPKQLEIRPKVIVAKKHDGSSDVYPLVVSIEPDSSTALQRHENEGVGIRLQLRDDTPDPHTSFLSTAVKQVGSELNILERGYCQCGCKTCGLVLFVDHVKFNRILPLPSQTWRDLFNNWSCCSSAHSKGQTATPAYVTKSSFKPREGDCLLDDFNIYVHSKVVQKRNVLFQQNSAHSKEKESVQFNHMADDVSPVFAPDRTCVSDRRKKKKDSSRVYCVKCARCRALLGETQLNKKRIESFQFYKSSIEVLALQAQRVEGSQFNKNSIEMLALQAQMCEATVKRQFIFSEAFRLTLIKENVRMNPCPILFRAFCIERLLAQQLSNAVASHSTHLFVIQDTVGNTFLLIRVMNTTSRLFVNNGKSTNDPSNSSKQFPSKTEADEANKENKPQEKSFPCHNGGGDGFDAAKAKQRSSQKYNSKREVNIISEVIRKGGPSRMLGSKVAEVIERLFSFSTHLISIGRGYINDCDPSGCERIVKVMYTETFEEKTRSKLVLSWLRDERTVKLTYPRSTCIQILLILLSSTLTLPVAHRVLDDFVVGFLRLD